MQTSPPSSAARIIRQGRIALVIAKKDARIYYLKPPVISFGIVFPLFFYLAFAAGRPLPVAQMVPGILAMALFFTASAVGPLVTPWERQARTYERLMTSPASLGAALSGDMLAGAAFGVILSLVPLLVGAAVFDAAIQQPLELILGIGLGALSFSAMGVLLAAPATDTPSQIMMLSNLVRLPVIFVSGVFVPIPAMPAWGQWLAPLSPLSYAVDLIRVGFGERSYFGPFADAGALLISLAIFIAAARYFHGRARRQAK
jgi:ABC-2 type transport system permease protein